MRNKLPHFLSTHILSETLCNKKDLTEHGSMQMYSVNQKIVPPDVLLKFIFKRL